ncbi:MAG TPA: DsbA family oxidoreductase [Acidimicrobiales bacterium]
MSEPFVIDIWSDVVCPFCYLGTRQLADALSHFEHRDNVELRHRAFELDPTAKLHYDASLEELVAQKYSMPVSSVQTMHVRMQGEARQLGMEWSLGKAQPTNTFDAHRVIALATTQGLGGDVSERLFRAYFCEGELISDHERLSELAGEVGVTGVDELWGGDAFAANVRGDEAAAQELGITGVPCLLLDGKFMVVGAQGSDQILDVLRRAWSRRAA